MLLLRWTVLCALAELLGIAAAALWYGGMNIWLGEPESVRLRIGVWLLMSMAAIPEGAVLGGLQGIGLRWFLPGVSIARWITATIGVGLLGWGIGTFIPMFLVIEAAPQSGPEPGLGYIALFAAAFGLAVGAIFGLAQAWALPKQTPRRSLWVWANTVGWAFGLPMIYVAAHIGADYQGWLPRLAWWAISGCAAGAMIGIATGVALVAMRNAFRPSRGNPDRLPHTLV